MKRKIVEGITVKRVRPEGCIYEQCSDMLLNWRDIRSKFGYKMLYAIWESLKTHTSWRHYNGNRTH